MAFNPFSFFRKYQKVFFGILAIICMLVFVLQFGAGDPFGRAMSWFGASRNKGAHVATVYGQRVNEGQLGDLQYDRQIATEFLFELLYGNHLRVTTQERTRFGPPRLVPAGWQNIEKIPGSLGVAAKAVLANVRDRGDRFSTPMDQAERAQIESRIRRDLDKLRNELVFARSGADNKSEYLALETSARGALDDLLLYVQYEAYILGTGSNFADLYTGATFFDPTLPPLGGFRNRGTNRTYYLGGGRTTEDLLDFLVWKHQADVLGISLTESAVLRLAFTNTGIKAGTQSESFANDKTVDLFLKRRASGEARGNITAAKLLAAVREEFRVALARETLTGRPAPGTFPALALSLLPTTPAQASTAEAFEGFRRLTATAKVGLLEIPVDAFLTQVEQKKLEPTEAQLQDLFDKYKNDEPAPERSRPGFKEPRRVKVQYLHITGESPFIQEQARRIRNVSEALLPVGAALGAGTLNSNAIAAAAAVTAPQRDFPALREYERYKEQPTNTLEGWANRKNPWDPVHETLPVRDTSWVRNGPLASLFGNLGAALPAQGSLANSLVAYRGLVQAYEEGDLNWQTRKLLPAIVEGQISRVLSAHLLHGGMNPALIGAIYPTVTATMLRHPTEFLEPLPFAALLPLFRDQEQDALKTRVRADLLQDAYEEIRKQRGKLEADAGPALEKYLKEKNLTPFLHTTPYAQDYYEFRKEPTLQELRGLLDRAIEPGMPRVPDGGASRSASMAFSSNGTYDPLRWSPRLNFQQMENLVREMQAQNMPAAQIQALIESFHTQSLADPGAILFWRTEDRASNVPTSLDQFVWLQDKRVKVREKVIPEWKLIQAKRLAEDYAAKVRDEAKKLKGTQNIDATVQWLRDQKPGTFKELPELCRLFAEKSTAPTDPVYHPFRIPSNIIEYPRAETVEKLMDSLKDIGDVALVADLPIRNWYVALCESRNEPRIGTFLNLDGSGSRSLSDRFYTEFIVPQEEKSYEEKILKRLRYEAGKDDLDGAGRWRIPSEVRARFERGEAE
jgi:hypothetical protein